MFLLILKKIKYVVEKHVVKNTVYDELVKKGNVIQTNDDTKSWLWHKNWWNQKKYSSMIIMNKLLLSNSW